MPLHELYRAAVDPLRAVRLVRDGEFVSIEFVSADRPRPLFTLPGIAATPDHVRAAARVVGGLVRRMRTVLQGADAVKALAAEFPGLKVDDLSLRQDHNGFRAILLLTMPDGAHHRVAVGEENIAALGDARPHGAMLEKLRAFAAREVSPADPRALKEDRLRTVHAAVEALGWRLRSVEYDAGRGTARIEATRNGRLVVFAVDGHGRTMIERFAVQTVPTPVGRRGDRFIADRVETEFLGRSRPASAREGLMDFAGYLVENGVQTGPGLEATRNALILLAPPVG